MPKNNINALSAEIINPQNLQDKIYEIRGQKVMLDYDLAAIYGYTTSAFNQQVRNNKEKFEGEEFMFQLTRDEVSNLMCQKVTSNFLISKNLISKTDGRGGTRKLPYAFTEQGIYMLMTVLRGPLATKQSRALIMLFKSMKDYIVESHAALDYQDNLKLISQTIDQAKDIAEVKTKIADIDEEVKMISRQMQDTITKSEISPIILDFTNRPERHEFLFMDGELAKASETYQAIYARAKSSIVIMDDYINIKTLRHLRAAAPNIKITIFSDNAGGYLHASDYKDFRKECPDTRIDFIVNDRTIHDRFIVIDRDTAHERVFHCGASSKDAGSKLTAITEFTDEMVRRAFGEAIRKMLSNPKLILK